MPIDVSTSSIAPCKNNIRKIFAPYFRARWQNMQNIICNNLPVNQMPAQWITYYNTFIRQWDEWSRGFVLRLHSKDMFSVGMGYTICDIFTRECMKGGFRFEGDEYISSFLESWANTINFRDKLANGFLYANRLGNALLRLNIVRGEDFLYPTVHGVDKSFFEINKRGQIIRARFCDRVFTNTYNSQNYGVIEDRIMLSGKPYYRVSIYHDTGTANNPMFSNEIKGAAPEDIKDKLLDLYGDIEFGEWYSLPFGNSLGVYNWKNKPCAIAVPDMEGYSDSTLHTALDILYSIDYNWSNGQFDQYVGKARVLVPEQMKPVRVNALNRVENTTAQGVDLPEILLQDAPLEDDFYSQYPSDGTIDGKPAQPIIIQPDLRGEPRKYIRDADLELLASKVGLSSTTLANHLAYNTSKTATQENDEQDTTDVSVKDKRDLALSAINGLIKDILAYHGLVGQADLKWNQPGQNSTTHRKEVLEEYNDGLLPAEDAIKALHPELTEKQVQERVSKITTQNATDSIFQNKIMDGNKL